MIILARWSIFCEYLTRSVANLTMAFSGEAGTHCGPWTRRTRCSCAASNWHRREACYPYGWEKPTCEQKRYRFSFGGIAAHIRRDLSQQVRDIVEEGRDQTALLSRQVETDSIKIDAYQQELARSIHTSEIISNKIRVLAAQQGSGQQEILAAFHETNSGIRNLAEDQQSLSTSVSRLKRFEA